MYINLRLIKKESDKDNMEAMDVLDGVKVGVINETRENLQKEDNPKKIYSKIQNDTTGIIE